MIVREHIYEYLHFKRGREPKDAMGTGIWSNLLERANRIIAEHPEQGPISEISNIGLSQLVDEETGELHDHFVYLRTLGNSEKGVLKNIKFILDEMGLPITGKWDYDVRWGFIFYLDVDPNIKIG